VKIVHRYIEELPNVEGINSGIHKVLRYVINRTSFCRVVGKAGESLFRGSLKILLDILPKCATGPDFSSNTVCKLNWSM
jgi:hypothetical protein